MSFFKKKKDTNSPPTLQKPEFAPMHAPMQTPPILHNPSHTNQQQSAQSAFMPKGGLPPGASFPNPNFPSQQYPQSQPQGPPPSSSARYSTPLGPGLPPLQSQQSTSSLAQDQQARRPSGGPPSQVVYPWSARPLHYQSISLAPPTPPEFADPSGPVTQVARFKEGPSPPPFPRYGHSVNPLANASSGDLYIFGGLVADRACNDLYVLSCLPNSSSSIQAAKERGETNLPALGSVSVGLVETKGEIPGPRLGHASVGVGNVLIVWGGDTNTSDDEESSEPNDDALYLLNLSKSTVDKAN